MATTHHLLDLGDDFEKLLRARLNGHQEHLDKHRTNVFQKIEWLSPERTQSSASPPEATCKQVQKPRHASTKQVITEHPTAPVISSSSERLAMKKRMADGVLNMPIEESLAVRADKSKTEKWLKSQYYAERENPGRPMISVQAAAMPSSSIEETTQRLYQTGVSNEKVLQALKVQLETLVSENMELTFTPTITPRAKHLTRRPNQTAFDDLYSQAVERKNHRENLRARLGDERESELRSRTPTINRLSTLIAERLPERSEVRLQKTKMSLVEAKPSSTRTHSTSRTLALHNDHVLRKARALQSMAEHENLPEECTFTPTINPSKGSRPAPLWDRSAAWEVQRKQKLTLHHAELKMEESSECTFQPLVNSSKKYVETQNAHAGVAEFLARQNAARELNASQQQPPTPPAQKSNKQLEDNDALRKAKEALERARTATKRQT